jgi:hypothetical protein
MGASYLETSPLENIRAHHTVQPTTHIYTKFAAPAQERGLGLDSGGTPQTKVWPIGPLLLVLCLTPECMMGSQETRCSLSNSTLRDCQRQDQSSQTSSESEAGQRADRLP